MKSDSTDPRLRNVRETAFRSSEIWVITKGETITRVNGNVSFLLVNVYKISKRVNEGH